MTGFDHEAVFVAPAYVDDAVLVIVAGRPVVPTVAVTVYVIFVVPDGAGKLTVPVMSPEPLADGQVAPPAPAQVQVHELMPDGFGSEITTPLAAPGPALVYFTV